MKNDDQQQVANLFLLGGERLQEIYETLLALTDKTLDDMGLASNKKVADMTEYEKS